jgi:hypothetical protein
VVFTIFSENWDTLSDPKLNYAIFDQTLEMFTGPSLMLTIKQTKHADFTVVPLLSPLTTLIGLKGPIEGQRGLNIINSLSLTFFDQVFHSDPQFLSKKLFSEYDEIIWDSHP